MEYLQLVFLIVALLGMLSAIEASRHHPNSGNIFDQAEDVLNGIIGADK